MTFIGSIRLEEILKSAEVISPFDKKRIKNGSYELSLGDQTFQTDANPRSIKKLGQEEKIHIHPGQFALLLTEETIKVPKDKIAFISIKAKIKFKGLVNVSGFHVDPGFEGKLLFSVYNAGPSIIVLSRGENYFPIWFADITETEDYSGTHDRQQNIPDAPVEALIQGELASPSILSKRIDENYSSLTSQLEVNKGALEARIALIEKEQTAKDYLIKTGVGLAIIILVKIAFDWISYNNGFSKAIELTEKQAKLDSVINFRLSEKKNLIQQIDSLNKINVTLKRPNTSSNGN